VHAGHNTLGDFAHDDVVRASSERVPLETLDSVVARHGLSKVDVVKIDVEGGEAGVVAGAKTVLTSMRPLLLMELNERALHAQHQSASALLQTLRSDLSYEVLVFSHTTGLIERPPAGSALSPNVVAVPMERLAEFVK